MKKILKYRHHANGQAFVRVAGKNVYLGKFGSPESREAYGRVINKLLDARANAKPVMPNALVNGPTISEVILAYMQHAESYYVKTDGQPSGETDNIASALRPLKALYGSTPAEAFAPVDLKAVRQELIKSDLCRGVINQRIGIIKRMLHWAADENLITPSVYANLLCVRSLAQGRSPARETNPVKPVDAGNVEAVIQHLPPMLRAMVRIQWLTGMRSSELVNMRLCDLDRSGDVWLYRPGSHKTEHHGVERNIPLNRQCQELLLPYIHPGSPQACLFSPQAAQEERKAIWRAHRKTPVQPSQQNRYKPNPERMPGDKYNRNSYRMAIVYALRQVNKPILAENVIRKAKGEAELPLIKWHPHQLRHNAATEVRREHGLEAARALLGHRSAGVTEMYAERDAQLAIDVMRNRTIGPHQKDGQRSSAA